MYAVPPLQHRYTRRDLNPHALRHMILPAVALSTIPMALIARMARSAMLEVLGQDYIRTARAKGLRRTVVVMKHAFRNALLPLVTVIGLSLGSLLGGILGSQLAPSPGLATLPVSCVILGLALSTIPAALVMQRIGRRRAGPRAARDGDAEFRETPGRRSERPRGQTGRGRRPASRRGPWPGSSQCSAPRRWRDRACGRSRWSDLLQRAT